MAQNCSQMGFVMDSNAFRYKSIQVLHSFDIRLQISYRVSQLNEQLDGLGGRLIVEEMHC